MAPTPNSALLAAHLREDTADLLALLPAARRAAAGGPGGGFGFDMGDIDLGDIFGSFFGGGFGGFGGSSSCLLYTSPSPRDTR